MAKQHMGVMRRMEQMPKHRSVAENVDAFDSRFLGASKVPQVSVERGHPTRPTNPRAVGQPALARRSDGTENLRVTTVTKKAEILSQPSGRKRTPAQSFRDDVV